VLPARSQCGGAAAGRVMVLDGHDYSRPTAGWDYVCAPISSSGFGSKAGRYEYDYVTGRRARRGVQGDPREKPLLRFGQLVLARQAGTIVVSSTTPTGTTAPSTGTW